MGWDIGGHLGMGAESKHSQGSNFITACKICLLAVSSDTKRDVGVLAQ